MFRDDEVFGDFEDLETGEQHVAANPEGDQGEDAEPGNSGGLSAEDEERRLKKLALRARFDAQYNEGSEDAAEEPLVEKEKSKRYGGNTNESGEKDYFDQVCFVNLSLHVIHFPTSELCLGDRLENHFASVSTIFLTDLNMLLLFSIRFRMM